MAKIKKINKKYVREFRIRFYGEKNCKIFDEFRVKKKLFNIGKKMAEKEYINNIFVNYLIPFMKNDIVESNIYIIKDTLEEIIKKTLSKNINNVISLINFKSEIINENQYDIAKILTYLTRMNILANNLSTKDFDSGNSKNFELPSWSKLKNEKEK